MGDGKLRCCGSSLFLKKTFGVGYNMTIEKKDANKFDSRNMEETVMARIPQATILTDVGTELTFQLPLDSSDRFPSLFDYIDNNEVALGVQSYGVSVTTLEEVFIKVAHATKTIAQQDIGAKEGRRGSQTNKRLANTPEDDSKYESKLDDLEAVEDGAIVIEEKKIVTFEKVYT
jgi:hypothetical protein